MKQTTQRVYGTLLTLLTIACVIATPWVFPMFDELYFKLFLVSMMIVGFVFGYYLICRSYNDEDFIPEEEEFIASTEPVKKTMIDIILEVAEFYTSENRAAVGMQCRYLTDDGKQCAFSIYCTDEAVEQLKEVKTNLQGLAFEPDYYLRPEYHGYEPTFWIELQQFHDMYRNWDEKGLTSEGRLVLSRLLKIYKN